MRTWNSTHVDHNEQVLNLELGAPIPSTKRAKMIPRLSAVAASCKTSARFGLLDCLVCGKSVRVVPEVVVDDAITQAKPDVTASDAPINRTVRKETSPDVTSTAALAECRTSAGFGTAVRHIAPFPRKGRTLARTLGNPRTRGGKTSASTPSPTLAFTRRGRTSASYGTGAPYLTTNLSTKIATAW